MLDRRIRTDPNAPKKPSTPFLIFATENRPNLPAEMPNIQKTRCLAEKWKGMTEEEKQVKFFKTIDTHTCR